MPLKTDAIPIGNPKLDKRVSLSAEQKDAIREEYKTGLISIHKLSEKYGVSRRLIQFTLFPERQAKAKAQFAERQKDGRYYDKDKHRDYMKKHRDYKKELWEAGLLKDSKQ